MSNIGFFGGCFNPPTNVHIKLANSLIEQGKLDKVIFIPVNDYYKKEGLVQAKHRYNMLKLAIKNYKNLDVDDIEIKENKKLFAVDAFEIISSSYLKKNVKKENMFFIMGSDNYCKMSAWKDYTKIKDMYNYLVIERDKKEVSSTQIRKMIIKKDCEVTKYLAKSVYNYIKENELYRM